MTNACAWFIVALRESRGGRPGLPVLMNLMVSVDVKQHCENRGGRPGLPVLMSLMVSVDVKHHV